MERLTTEGRRTVEELAQRHGVSTQAVTTLLQALISGHGTMAQFDHAELGGLGQWSQGGMVMIGDMFNGALKAKVDALCSELASLLNQDKSLLNNDKSGMAQGASGDWWGADLGAATATGSQNDIRYAYFSAARRLAVRIGAKLTIYNTGEHQIKDISQRQNGNTSLTFASQRGPVRVEELDVVSQSPDPSAAVSGHRQ